MNISAVIPTRNRPSSLRRVLRCLSLQTLAPAEVIIVDASDVPLCADDVTHEFPALRFRFFHTAPGLCKQRNVGIRQSTRECIFLCDDDIEFSRTYLASLAEYLGRHAASAAVSGEILEQDAAGVFRAARSAGSVWWLLWCFLFQFTVWQNVDQIHSSPPARALLTALQRYNRRRGNTVTAAGWPLVTQMGRPVYSALVYGLGASLIRRSCLQDPPFDEALHISGIGDHYGVAIGFPGREPITVIASEPLRHYREGSGRVAPEEAFALRVFALDRFMHRSPRFGRLNTLALRWSLVGYCLFFLRSGDTAMMKSAWHTLLALLFGRNPYRKGEGKT